MIDEQKLTEFRQQIDDIDAKLVVLLNERARIALQVGIVKGDRAIYRPEREAQVLANVSAKSEGPLSNNGIETIFKAIITVCRTIQQTK
jgi:chorismate mutase/prephenate dehydratase